MTIKELKKHIKDMPDDAEALFGLWQSNDRYTYFHVKKSNAKVREITTGGNVAVIGIADNCQADMMIEKENGKFEY